MTKTPDQTTYHYGDVVWLMAVPETGYYFTGWIGNLSGSTNPADLTITGDMSVTAAFSNQYTLTVNVIGSGTVSKVPEQTTYTYNQVVTLAPTPATGWSFSVWSGACTGNGDCVVTMDGNKTVTATFTYQYTLRETFDSISGWTIKGLPKGYSAIVDTINKKEGTGSIKLTNPNNGYVQITKSVNWTLTALEQGYFQFWVYVYGTSEPTTVSIILANDKAYKNYFITNYGGDFKFNLRPGWNLITLDQSDWMTGAGSPSWTKPILGIRITINGGVTNSYSFDQLISGAGLVP